MRVGGTVDFTWNGPSIGRAMKDVAALYLSQLGLATEGEAKKQLRPGHGVVTGTLRRSVHCAKPEYSWPDDDVTPSASSPERGGEVVTPQAKKGTMTISVGSGMHYAAAMEELYEYLQMGYQLASKNSQKILDWSIAQVK